jgi:transcription termination factor Rho
MATATNCPCTRGVGEEHPSGGVERGKFEMLPDGFGFVRLDPGALGYGRGDNVDEELYPVGHRDIYVPPSRIREYRLNDRDQIKCGWRDPTEADRYRSATIILEVNGNPTGH